LQAQEDEQVAVVYLLPSPQPWCEGGKKGGREGGRFHHTISARLDQ
jgi:hypothetical protein